MEKSSETMTNMLNRQREATESALAAEAQLRELRRELDLSNEQRAALEQTRHTRSEARRSTRQVIPATALAVVVHAEPASVVSATLPPPLHPDSLWPSSIAIG